MSDATGSRKWWFLSDLVLAVVANAGIFLCIRYAFQQLNSLPADAETQKKIDAQKRSRAVLRRLAEREKQKRQDAVKDGDESFEEETVGDESEHRTAELVLSQYEQAIAAEVVHPEDIKVSFDDIGGLEDIIEELRESVIYPLTQPHLYASSSTLLSAPAGVLLYGPPGCGKTMLAKALAHESGACFINLHISTLTDKWFGETNKLTAAVFSLARKLQPSIVFIDEIDAVLGTRRAEEHETTGSMKAEFMTHWDGLLSADDRGEPQRIVILGATNRPNEIDAAMLRRMPKKFPVHLPAEAQRRKILDLILTGTKIDRSDFDAGFLVKIMAGMSGSEIKEACRDAAMVPVREALRRSRDKDGGAKPVRPESIRGIRTEDFVRDSASDSKVARNLEMIGDHAMRTRNKGGKVEEWSTEDEGAGESDEEPVRSAG